MRGPSFAPGQRTIARGAGEVAARWRGLWDDLYGVITFDGPLPVLWRPDRPPVRAVVAHTAPDPTAGRYGPCFAYDGADDTHTLNEVATENQTNGLGAGQFAVLAVARPLSFQSSGYLCGHSDDSSSNDWWIRRRSAAAPVDDVKMMAWNGSSFVQASFGVTHTDGNWHSLVGVYNGAALAAYRRGVLVTSTAMSARGGTKSNAFTLGNNISNTANFAAGVHTALIAVWNRPLTANEARLLSADPFAPFLRAGRTIVPAFPVRVLENGTERAKRRVPLSTLLTNPKRLTLDLTAAERAAITDWSALQLEVGAPSKGTLALHRAYVQTPKQLAGEVGTAGFLQADDPHQLVQPYAALYHSLWGG